ncbi:MAG TPA: hypothetical protein VGF28_01295 [Thermoanaerobaculia bacterium]
MERRFQGPDISMWRYESVRRSHQGIHFNASAEACDTLLHLLRELSAATGEVHRTIPLKPLDPKLDPTGFNAHLLTYAALRLEVVDPDDEIRQMNASTEGDRVTIRITRPFVPELVDALENVRQGGGDFGLGPTGKRRELGPRDRDSDTLVFWWQRRR